MRKNLRFVLSSIGIILFAIVAYLFIWGKLFPFSPIIVGFTKHELSNTIIYLQKGNSFTTYSWIDSLIPVVEKFHELKMQNRPKIFFFNDENTYASRSLSKARFCAFYNGNIVVSPWAQREAAEGKISLEIYLRHELSHSLIFQNKGILMAYRYPKWLLEGLATYSTNQMGTSFYPSKEETYDLIRRGNFMPPQYFETNQEDSVKLDTKYRSTFMYSEFACIVDDLIVRYGREKFLRYMKTLLSNDNHNLVFKEVYGIDFENYISDFKKIINKAG
jgi:hypothetical protein